MFKVSVIGKSIEDRSLWLIRIAEPGRDVTWRVFFYAQQHGNEPAGKEALIYLAKSIQEDPRILPRGVELWLMPMVNPDGAENDRRRNAAGADLNRDHMTLDQPETRALHQVIRDIAPHLSIDCHEFTRDSDDYRERGWLEWSDIMMDYANYPLLDDQVVAQGAQLVERMAKIMAKKEVNFHRYFVGGAPPDGEQRFSAPDMDGGLNGVAIYGGLSFIIECGVFRQNNPDNHDLPHRVHSYMELLTAILQDQKIRKQHISMLKAQEQSAIPEWIPTNYFWAKLDESVSSILVIDSLTMEKHTIPAPNFMPELVIKKSVSTPKAYFIEAEHEAAFRVLLDRHSIPFELIDQPISLAVQECRLDTIEMDFDDLYHRYGGRTLVTLETATELMVQPGGILIPVESLNGRRVIALLEPSMLYGLYQYPGYQSMITEEKIIPVSRVLGR